MNASLDRDAAEFEAHRRALTGFAYRMLGSRAEAEAGRASLPRPNKAIGWPRRLIPVPAGRDSCSRAPHRHPREQRGPRPATCLPLHLGSRLRGNDRREHGRRVGLTEVWYKAAVASGDTGALMRVLAEDAVLYSDGGGKRAAALNPIYGADRIARFFAGVLRKNSALATVAARSATVNGLPGFVMREDDGSIDTMAIEHRDGRIVAIYLTRNPEKLRHVRF